MTGTTGQDVATVPRIARAEALRIAAVENAAFAALLGRLGDDDWDRPTDCTLWDVRATVAHVVGSAAGQASPLEFFRQVRRGRPLQSEMGSPYWWDGMNQFQVVERAGRTDDELVAEWDSISPRALRARARLPRPVARLPLLNFPAPVGRQPLSYLFHIGFTRDVWMHRMDLARATGTAPDLDPGHDGRIVADIVAEWAGTHGEACSLELGGPAGGRFVSGTGGEDVALDAVDFCRILAGRDQGTGVLRHPLPL